MCERIKPAILVVDDDETMRDTLESILRDDYNVLKAEDGEKALDILKEYDINIVFLDILLPGMDGLMVLENIRKYHKDVDVIMGSVVKKAGHIVEAMKLGAYDYLTKDFDYDEIRLKINRLVEHQKRERELASLQEKVKAQMENEFIMGKSKLIQRVWEKVKGFSKSDLPIFITGEAGAGKQLLASKIHEQSDRENNPFVPINLYIIPQDSIDYVLFGNGDPSLPVPKEPQAAKIELSHRGTLFIKGIEYLSEKAQQRLLTVIERKEIEKIGSKGQKKADFRLITASNKTFEDLLKEGKLDNEFLVKISAFKLELPPLRERLEDIPGLVRYFIKKYSSKLNKDITDITPQCLRFLENYRWPGNVGELERLVQKLIIFANDPKIIEDDIPIEYRLLCGETFKPRGKSKDSLSIARDILERDLIYKILHGNDWSRKKTAECLGIPYNTLKYKLRKYGLLKVEHM